jgi:hypothetical protein
VIIAILRNKRQNSFKGILSFDRVLRFFGYYGKKLQTTQLRTKISD